MADEIVKVSARLFASDVRKLKQIAKAKLVPWHQELRLMVHALLERSVEPSRKGPDDPR